eukprot:scaffold3116_cov101-Isochrysis_galbana.AAC.2
MLPTVIPCRRRWSKAVEASIFRTVPCVLLVNLLDDAGSSLEPASGRSAGSAGRGGRAVVSVGGRGGASEPAGAAVPAQHRRVPQRHRPPGRGRLPPLAPGHVPARAAGGQGQGGGLGALRRGAHAGRRRHEAEARGPGLSVHGAVAGQLGAERNRGGLHHGLHPGARGPVRLGGAAGCARGEDRLHDRDREGLLPLRRRHPGPKEQVGRGGASSRSPAQVGLGGDLCGAGAAGAAEGGTVHHHVMR